jgi:regulator of nucleoside diphosphate kinase
MQALRLKINVKMKDNMIVTLNDYQRLMGLIEITASKAKVPEIVSKLYANLCAARMLPQEDIDRNVITMNSRVRLKDLANQRETEITLTYPVDAAPIERRVSVLSEIGLSLFGRRKNDVVSWKIPNGVGLFQIVEVTYQPEAAGDYFL